MRQFVERWYGEDGAAFDVIFDPGLARFEVIANDTVVFSHAAFVEVLRWCMREEPMHVEVEAVDVSPPFDPEE